MKGYSKAIYLIDKSIQNEYYYPFLSHFVIKALQRYFTGQCSHLLFLLNGALVR